MMDDMTPKQQTVSFTLDGKPVTADAGQTIWQVAQEAGTDIPHLCYKDDKGYRADGNCRACMVEIEGERVLAASCQRKIADGMVVTTASPGRDRPQDGDGTAGCRSAGAQLCPLTRFSVMGLYDSQEVVAGLTSWTARR